MKEKLIIELNKKKVHYGDNVLKVRDLFSRKQESLSKQDDKFFSKYWQVYAWSAIIGFVNDKREVGAPLPNQTSFEFQMISNGSDTIANGLMLMAIGRRFSMPSIFLRQKQDHKSLLVISASMTNLKLTGHGHYSMRSELIVLRRCAGNRYRNQVRAIDRRAILCSESSEEPSALQHLAWTLSICSASRQLPLQYRNPTSPFITATATEKFPLRKRRKDSALQHFYSCFWSNPEDH